jgi:hypothetical protein
MSEHGSNIYRAEDLERHRELAGLYRVFA